MALPVSRKKRIAGIAIVGVLLASGAGAAYAYWTSGGNGTGAASTGTTVAFEVSSATAVGDPLFPAGPSQSVTFTVANPGDAPQMLTDVVVTVAEADGSTWNDVAGCSAADYTVSSPVFDDGEIAAGEDTTGTVEISMNNTGANQDGCKLAAVPLYILAS